MPDACLRRNFSVDALTWTQAIARNVSHGSMLENGATDRSSSIPTLSGAESAKLRGADWRLTRWCPTSATPRVFVTTSTAGRATHDGEPSRCQPERTCSFRRAQSVCQSPRVHRPRSRCKRCTPPSTRGKRSSRTTSSRWAGVSRPAGRLRDSGAIDGPLVEAKEIIGGSLVVAADSVDVALDIAAGCPGLIGPGSSCEIREMFSA